jgi:hypothetical protein
MPAVFTSEAARRIAAATLKVEHLSERRGRPIPPGQVESDFWAWITGCDLSGRRYSFARVYPDASTDDPDLILEETGLKWRLFDTDDAGTGLFVAFEINGNRGAVDRIVRLSFGGIGPDGDPSYVFQYSPSAEEPTLPVHDHRDNLHGGFAFSCWHPGTSLPQMPWAV